MTSAPAAETIFALSSGHPPAAVAVIRISGPAAHQAAAALCGDLPAARQCALRPLSSPTDRNYLDSALVLRFDAPQSATGEDVVEFQCHGGPAVVDSVLTALGSVTGCRPAQAGEFTRRAVDHGKLDLIAAEGLADLLSADTEAERRAAVLMANGDLRKQIERWRDCFIDASADLSRAIDMVGEDDEGEDFSLPASLGEALEEMKVLLARPRAERIREGFRVVIAGPPNAGKSSLFNQLLESDRAIVSDIAGTTRDHIEANIRLGFVPVTLVDTAGTRQTDDPLEREGVKRAGAQMARADLILWLGPAQHVPPGDVLVISAKSDLRPERHLGGDEMEVSALTGEGILTLISRIQDKCVTYLPDNQELILNNRQAQQLSGASEAGRRALDSIHIEIAAHHLLEGIHHLDALTARNGFDDLSSAIFSRFCLGK